MADLPPRPPVIPRETQSGAYIKLTVENALPNVWTEVHWQDAQGDWHPVEGWRGTLDDGTTKLWWVAPRDFDTGPFRWVVYATQASDIVIAISQSFNLSEHTNTTVLVNLTLEQAN